MLFKLSNLNSNLALTLGYLNLALNNSAQIFYEFAPNYFQQEKGVRKIESKQITSCLVSHLLYMLYLLH